MKCPKCGKENNVKNGIVNGKQRYKCKNCKCNYTQSYVGKVKFSKKVMALKLYLEGMGFRGIGRVLGISYVSVLNWIRMFGMIALEIQKIYLSNLKEIITFGNGETIQEEILGSAEKIWNDHKLNHKLKKSDLIITLCYLDSSSC